MRLMPYSENYYKLTLYYLDERIRPVLSGPTCHLQQLYLQGIDDNNWTQMDEFGPITPVIKG